MRATRRPSFSAVPWRSRLLAVATAAALVLVPTAASAEPETVGPGSGEGTAAKHPTSASVHPSGSIVAGGTAYFEVDLDWDGATGTPTGVLYFTSPFGTIWTPSLSGTVGYFPVEAGTHVIGVRYPGDERYEESSAELTVDVPHVVPTVAVSLDPTAPVPGQTVTATATVVNSALGRGSTAAYGGPVDFLLPDGATVRSTARTTSTGTSTASATFTAGPGSQTVSAATSQDRFFSAATGQGLIEVDRLTTVLDLDVPQAHALEERTITVTASVATGSVVPTGEVDLTAGPVGLGQVELVDGSAVWTGRLPVGGYDVTATYDGDAATLPASATEAVVVVKAPTETMLTVPTLVVGKDAEASVEVVVPGLPGETVHGTVELVADGTLVSTGELVDGLASLDVPGTFGAGPVTLEARFLGGDLLAASSGPVATTVERAAPQIITNVPAVLTPGEPWTVDVDVRAEAATLPDDPDVPVGPEDPVGPGPGPVLHAVGLDVSAAATTVGTGEVRVLLDGAEVSSTTLVDGRATVVVDSADWDLSPGTYTVSVAYEGDTNFAPRSVEALVVVEAVPVVVPPVVEPPVVEPPVVDPPVVTPPGEEPPTGEVPVDPPVLPVPPSVGPDVVAPLPGAVQPTLQPAPAATPRATETTERTGALAQSGADLRLLLLLGPLLLAGATLVAARRSARSTTR